MEIRNNEKNSVDLTTIITNAIKVPGVKVSRTAFLEEQFKDLSKKDLNKILKKGTIEAGISREVLKKKANKLVKERSAISTSASFLAGLPGGFAMAATIPADMLQFYAVALRMAQELVYLYGEEDIWCDGAVDPDKVTNQLILYCGVMLGATGASQTVRLMSSALAKQVAKKLPQKALTKTFYYPIVKSIVKAFGGKVTKNVFAKGVSKAVPIIGGVVSGGITLASMLPMGNRLIKALDKAHFDYSEEEIEKDIKEIANLSEADTLQEDNKNTYNQNEVFAKIKEAKEMLDAGIIDEEEFKEIKNKLIKEI